MSELNHVRCAGCRRTLAVTSGAGALRSKVYCNEWCMDEPAATEKQVRNDQWAVMRVRGRKQVYIAQQYQVPHSQVYKTIEKYPECPPDYI